MATKRRSSSSGRRKSSGVKKNAVKSKRMAAGDSLSDYDRKYKKVHVRAYSRKSMNLPAAKTHSHWRYAPGTSPKEREKKLIKSGRLSNK